MPAVRHENKGNPAMGTAGICLQKIRGRLRLVDLSRIPSGTFFREVHPDWEMTRQNHQIVMFHGVYDESCSGRCETVRPQELLGLAEGLWFAFDGSLGAGWLTWTPAAARARFARVACQVTRG